MSYITTLIASLLGSPHCALMCGGFAGISAQSSRPRLTQLCYHSGRLITYSSLGILAGYFGSTINLISDKFGIASIAAVLCGASLTACAIINLCGQRVAHINLLPFRVFSFLNLKLSAARSKSPLIILAMGIFSTLLPCGWLYTYLALAVATASPYQGVLLMFFFWLGTLPVLLSIGELSKILSDRLKKRIPIIVSILILISGILTIKAHFYNHTPTATNQELICR